ncbi:MAG TPA: hypothetical protein VK168_13105 [Saprospiraceae bacterium]|nr:hypothetical protein [Saprospiraceae bacterium]
MDNTAWIFFPTCSKSESPAHGAAVASQSFTVKNKKMGVSYSIITKREAQENSAWKEHIEMLKMFGNPNFSTDEINNNFPTLNEIYESIAETNIKIEKEMKQIDNIKCKEGKKEIIHSLDLRDDEAQGSEDFTMQYPESADDKYKIEVLLGIR